jgi:hypothetical protein
MIRVWKKMPKELKGSKVSSPKRLTVGQCWVQVGNLLTYLLTTDEETQPILWTEPPTGALGGAGSLGPRYGSC